MKTTQRTFPLHLLLMFTAVLTLMLCMTVQAGAYIADGKWGGEEKTGLVIFEDTIKRSYGDGSGYFNDTVYGLKDSAGKVVLPAKYWDIRYAGTNRVIVRPVRDDGATVVNGVIDLKGNVLYPFAAQSILYCEESNAYLVSKSSRNYRLLDSSFHEAGRFSYGYVNDWGNGFFCWKGWDSNGGDLFALYRFDGKSLATIAPQGARCIKLLRDGEIISDYGSRLELYDLYNDDGKCILSSGTGDFIIDKEYGYILASKFKKPEYQDNYTYIGVNDIRVNSDTWEPICCYGLINFYGEEILPFAYDKMAFTEDGVEFGNWTGERRLEQLSYGFSGSTPPTYYVYIFDTKTLTFDELKEYQPKLTDVPASAWYYDAVQWAADKTMIDGTARRLYPDDNAPRGEVIEYMWKAAGRPTPTVSNPFTDVSASDSYYNAVLWAYQQGVTTGTSAVTFAPAETCTRAQVVTFLWRAMKGAGTEAESAFADVGADAYYASPVAWAVGKSITNGTSATTFSPDATCTRAQILTFLYRAYNN